MKADLQTSKYLSLLPYSERNSINSVFFPPAYLSWASDIIMTLIAHDSLGPDLNLWNEG